MYEGEILLQLVCYFPQIYCNNGELRLSPSPICDTSSSLLWYCSCKRFNFPSLRSTSPDHCPLIDSPIPLTRSTPSPLIHHHTPGSDSAAFQTACTCGYVPMRVTACTCGYVPMRVCGGGGIHTY